MTEPDHGSHKNRDPLSPAPEPHTTDRRAELRTLLTAHTERLLETAAALDDVICPSRCDGWSRAHVLSHVARNADALGRLADWAVTGHEQEMYPGGTGGRDREIEAGVGRPPADLVADVRDSAARLAPRLDRVEEGAIVEMVTARGGKRIPPSALLPMRLREVVYHHADLDAGFGFRDIEPDLVAAFLADEVTRLQAHPKAPSMTLLPDGGAPIPVGQGGPSVSGAAADLLLWLARRDASGVTGPHLPDLPRGI